MTDSTVARRYANALFSLGKKSGMKELNKHGECLTSLKQALNDEPKLALVLKSPLINTEEKKAVIGAVLDKLKADKLMCNFCFLLADKNRLGSLEDISEWYGVLLDNANGILRGKAITAVRLDTEKQAALKKALQMKAGKEIELEFCIDPNILGGLVLEIGDKILDSSLRAQLGILHEILRRGM